MATPHEILAGMTEIANHGLAFAVAWHVVIGAALIATAQGWRPSPRMCGALLIVPFVSVAMFGWAIGDLLNGALFSVAAGVLATIAWRSSRAEMPRARWATALGAVMVLIAWLYPHFLHTGSQLAYLVASPMGLIPAPSLALVMGFSLLGFCPAGRGWSLAVAGFSVFYAAFGAVQLGMTLDLALLLGALGLAVRALSRQARGFERRLQLVS